MGEMDVGADRGAAKDRGVEQPGLGCTSSQGLGAGAVPLRWTRLRWAGALPAASGLAQLRWRSQAIFFGDTEVQYRRGLKQRAESGVRVRAVQRDGHPHPIIIK